MRTVGESERDVRPGGGGDGNLSGLRLPSAG